MPKQKDESKKGTFSLNLLDEQKQKDFSYVLNRIEQLKKTKQNVYGTNLEELGKYADKDYIPHKLSGKGRRTIVMDETTGIRGQGQFTELNKSDSWRSDNSQPNPYVKLNTALGILIDRNPTGIFSPGSQRYENSTTLIKQLYSRNWEIAKSKQQLKLFVYNLAKYGWAIARTYPLLLQRQVKKLVEYNQETPSKSKWEEVMTTEYNDIFRENLDPFNCWIDDMARPNNPFSVRDWAWRKVYSLDQAEEEFGNYENWKYVQKGGNTQERIGISVVSGQKKYQEQDLIEVYFYENRLKDLFVVVANGVPVIIEPLPIADNAGNKKLSCWQTYWTLRHAECPYGIGIYEAIRYDQSLLDKVRNMTIDQLVLSIYKMFFHQGTSTLTETGDIQIKPGIGKQMLNPKDINWLDVPGPGQEAWKGIEMFKNDLNETSGITESLMGTIVGKTAFETAQAKEAALKRLKGPLDNISEALEEDGYITVSLIQLLYSIPEVVAIADPAKIEAYLQEIKSDEELYQRTDTENGESKFEAKIYREFPLNLESDEKGNLQETEKTQFFRAKPGLLKWEGIIKIKGQSVLTPSKQLDKALDLEMTNITIPLMGQIAQEAQMAMMTGGQFNLDDSVYGKTLKQILKIYEKDPQEWLPNSWLEQPEEQEQPLIVPQGMNPQLRQTNPVEALLPPAVGVQRGELEADKLVPGGVRMSERPQSLGGKIIGGLAKTFRRV